MHEDMGKKSCPMARFAVRVFRPAGRVRRNRALVVSVCAAAVVTLLMTASTA